jgi:hypothetical protein
LATKEESMNRYRGRYGDWDDRERDDRRRERPNDDAHPYGVGADAAYGAPSGGRRARPRPFDAWAHDEWGRDERERDDRERETWSTEVDPAHPREVPGQVTESHFWAADQDNPMNDRLTGAELRRYQRHHRDYLDWREDRLRDHDRDYRAWREAQQRRYDAEYDDWRAGRRREGSERYGQQGRPGGRRRDW